MNIELMRKIDFYLGIPLCFILTWLDKALRRLKPSPKLAPSKLLFIELSEMGSTILADPAMRKAREKLKAELFFVIFKKNKASLELMGTLLAQNIFTLRDDNLFLFAYDVLRFIVWCRRNKIDTTIDLELFSRATAILTFLSRARLRVGFYRFHNEGLYRGDLLSHKVAYNPHIHIAKNFIALVNALLSQAAEVPYSKTTISDDEIQLQHRPHYSNETLMQMCDKISCVYPNFDRNAQRVVLINPNASELLPQRRWPQTHFSKLISMLLQDYSDIVVLVTGAPSEKTEAQNLCDDVAHPRCINFAGALKLQELPILYTLATLMLTNDSGPAHFAAVTDMPTYVIFGPETPKLYGALGNFTPIYANLACSPCVAASNHRKTPCQDNVCVKVITPETVLASLKITL